MTNDRAAEHARNRELEQVLDEMNTVLAAGKSALSGHPAKLEHPLVLLVGVARCGSTLLFQWLAASGAFCYPTNIASRFWAAPRFAALVQRAFLDLDTRNEILPPESRAMPYASNLGKTPGAASPHEFWYFWRRYFPFDDVATLPDDVLDTVDFDGFERDIAGFQNVYRKPLVMKGMIINHHLAEFARRVSNSVFVHVTRDPVDNAASLLAARERFFGDRARWYSFKPPEYEWLAAESPETQVVGQVLAVNASIAKQLGRLPDRSVSLSYEDFCRRPKQSWNKISDLLERYGCRLPAYSGPASFAIRRHEDDRSRLDQIKELLLHDQRFQTGRRK